ncbi:MAG: outer membrane beta-barrel protein, partial [Thermoanaerobaculia bacterium]
MKPFRALRALVLFSLLAPRGAALIAQTEKPVTPDALSTGASLSLFGEEPSRALSISGFGVGSYAYNFNTDKNSFEPSALAVAFSKVISDRVSVFAQLTVSREGASPFLADEGASADVSTDIDNLQLTWVPSAQSGLQITFGKFDSPLAIERDDAPLNFQATSSFLFQFARPVKFAGIQIHESFSEHFEGWAIVGNGWDVDHDNNKAKTVAFYGLWNPSLEAHVGLGVIQGAEKDNSTDDPRTTGVLTLLFQPAAKWALGGELVAGQEPHSSPVGGTAAWYAGMAFTHHRFGDHVGLTVRLDYMDDRDGSRTGQPQVLRSVTVSPQYLFGGGFFGVFRYLDRTSLRLPGLAVRLDVRYDRSTE